MPGTPDEYRRFQLKFEAAMLHWLDGSEAPDGVELFTAFRDRVTGAIRRVLDAWSFPPMPVHAVMTSRLVPATARVFVDFLASRLTT